MSFVSFVLGEKSADQLGLALLSQGTVVPAAPPTRDRTLVMPGRPGELDFGADLQPRVFTLSCACHKARTRQEFAECLRGLVAHLCGADGRPRTLRLIMEPETDRYYYVRYAGSLAVERYATWGQVTLHLVAHDPFAYALSPDVVTVTASPYQHSQRGTAPAEPLLRLQGVSTGVGGQQISIAVGTQTVVYRGALASGNWLEVDCAAKTAVRAVGESRTNVLPHLERPVFPPLVPGSNTVAVTVAGGASWSKLEIYARNRWL